jgi:hypothetical protein
MTTDTDKIQEDPVCDCGAPGQEGGHCPYVEDVGGEIEICECCEDCAYECANDI